MKKPTASKKTSHIIIKHRTKHIKVKVMNQNSAKDLKLKLLTPFNNFLPLAGKMLTYLEAMRKPRKHIVKTFAIGKTAILIEPKRDSPPCSEAKRVLIESMFAPKSSQFQQDPNYNKQHHHQRLRNKHKIQSLLLRIEYIYRKDFFSQQES